MMRLSTNEPLHGRCPDCGADMVMGSPESNAPGKLWCSNSEHDDWVPLSLMPDCTDAAEEGIARETLAVEPEPSHAELHARLRTSIELAKLRREVDEQRHAINKLHTALIVAGLWPRTLPALFTDPLTPL